MHYLYPQKRNSITSVRILVALLGLLFMSATARADNLTTCLDGRYPALCDHSKLTSAQSTRVETAEHIANLKMCLDGRYPALCRHGDLATEEAARVSKAEHAANLRMCLDGRYPALCRHGDLAIEEDARVSKAEAMHPKTASSAPRLRAAKGRGRGGYSGCEDGHWIDSVMDDGKIIKLEDGSLWRVDDVDTIDSALWLPVSDVVVCDDKIINTDDNESVHVIQIR